MTRKRLISLGIALIIIKLLIAPSLCISAATEGLLLWFNKVLPSLLPFIILINLLVGLNMLEPLSRRLSPITNQLWHMPGTVGFAFLMGLMAGYPMGAKIITQLVKQNHISSKEGEKALCFCNNCGPLFIVGTVGTILLKNTLLGYFLLFIHILSAVIMSFLLNVYKAPSYSKTLNRTTYTSDFQFAPAFTKAVENGMDTIVCVGGYIIFFSVLTQIFTDSLLFKTCLKFPLIKELSPSLLQGIFTGILELSSGVGALSKTFINTPSVYTLAFLAASISFGGFCVYFQTLFILNDISFSIRPYLLCKLFEGILSFLLTCIFYPMFFMYTPKTSLYFSFIWILITLILLPILYFVIEKISTSNHRPKKSSFKNL